MQKIRQGRSKTGNNSIDVTLNELEQRILGIIGHEYVTGLTNVPDSFPEEHDVNKTYYITMCIYTIYVSV